MKENFNNKINQLELTNFTCFSQANFEFSSGINVFIGENGTGKTHILKVLYASVKVNLKETYDDLVSSINKDVANNMSHQVSMLESLSRYFTKGANLSLIRNKDKPFFFMSNTENNVELCSYYQIISKKYQNGKESDSLKLRPFISPNLPFKNATYISSIDVMPFQKDIYSIIHTKALDTEGTIIDYIIALNAPLEKYIDPKLEEIIKNFKLEFGILDIAKKDDSQFYITDNQNKEIISKLNATGINKLAQIIYLIMNGSLTKDSILFWDEPEVNLNPKYISLVAKFLQTLAKAGVQIFVATHDYLLVHKLSLAAEYREQTDAPPMKFFSLAKGDDGTVVESGNTLAEIQNNAILDEYAAFYDLENTLFVKSRPQ